MSADYLPPEYRTTPGVKPVRYAGLTLKEISVRLRARGIKLSLSSVHDRIMRGIRLDTPTSVLRKYQGKTFAPPYGTPSNRGPRRSLVKAVWDNDRSPCNGCPKWNYCATHNTACVDYYGYVMADCDSGRTRATNVLRALEAEYPPETDVRRIPRKDLWRDIFNVEDSE